MPFFQINGKLPESMILLNNLAKIWGMEGLAILSISFDILSGPQDLPFSDSWIIFSTSSDNYIRITSTREDRKVIIGLIRVIFFR